MWPHVGKAKMWLSGGSLENCCKQTVEKCKQSFENWKNLLVLEHILALQHGQNSEHF